VVRRIDLDHNAGAPLRTCARAAISAALEAGPGNPPRRPGRWGGARAAVVRAREGGAAPGPAGGGGPAVFSGRTGAGKPAVRGAARARRAAGGRRAVVSSRLEHSGVQESLQALAAEGFEVRRCRVDGDGHLDEQHLRALVDDQVALVTLAAANHELGTRYE